MKYGRVASCCCYGGKTECNTGHAAFDERDVISSKALWPCAPPSMQGFKDVFSFKPMWGMEDLD